MDPFIPVGAIGFEPIPNDIRLTVWVLIWYIQTIYIDVCIPSNHAFSEAKRTIWWGHISSYIFIVHDATLQHCGQLGVDWGEAIPLSSCPMLPPIMAAGTWIEAFHLTLHSLQGLSLPLPAAQPSFWMFQCGWFWPIHHQKVSRSARLSTFALSCLDSPELNGMRKIGLF